MRFLITGASGFLGSRLIDQLSKKHEVIAASKVTSLLFKNKNIKTINFNFLDHKIDFSFLKNIDVVVHAAGLNEKECEDNLNYAKKINYEFPKILFEKCIKYKVKKFIRLSSIKVYGFEQNKKINEISDVNPYNNYSNLHALTDNYFMNFQNDITKIIILRLSNCYGHPLFSNYNNKLNILFDFISDAKKNELINIESKTNVKKNFFSIIEFIKIVDYLIFNFQKNSLFNVGSYNDINLLQLAENIQSYFKKFNKDIRIKHQFKSSHVDNEGFSYDCNKIFRETGIKFDCINYNEFDNIHRYIENNE